MLGRTHMFARANTCTLPVAIRAFRVSLRYFLQRSSQQALSIIVHFTFPHLFQAI